MPAASPQETWSDPTQTSEVTPVTEVLGALQRDYPEIAPFMTALGHPPEEQAAAAVAGLSEERDTVAELTTEVQLAIVMADSLHSNFSQQRAQNIAHHLLYLSRHPESVASYKRTYERLQDQTNNLSRQIGAVQADGFEPAFNDAAGNVLRNLHQREASAVEHDKKLPAMIITIFPAERRGERRTEAIATTSTDKSAADVMRGALSVVRDLAGLDPEDSHQRLDDKDPSPDPQVLTEKEQMFVDRYFLAYQQIGLKGLWERAVMLFVASGESVDPEAAEHKVRAWLTGAALSTRAVLLREPVGKHSATGKRAKQTPLSRLRQYWKSFDFDEAETYSNNQGIVTQEM